MRAAVLADHRTRLVEIHLENGQVVCVEMDHQERFRAFQLIGEENCFLCPQHIEADGLRADAWPTIACGQNLRVDDAWEGCAGPSPVVRIIATSLPHPKQAAV
jgi:hypothetical protein